jgi:HTH-type transcriptional regulator / antitoxin HigA
LQLEKVLGIPAGFWVNRQRYYDEYLAKETEREKFKSLLDWAEKFSIKEMSEKGWIEQKEDKINQIIEILSFFGVATPEQWDLVTQNTVASFRLAKTFDSNVEDIAAWLRRGELIAQDIPCKPYNKEEFLKLLKNDIRELTCQTPEIFQPELINLCASVGVAVAFVPQLKKARVSGATRWLSPTKALIQLSLRYKTDDQLWFTFYHEAGHIILHGKRDIYLETINDKDFESKKKEDEVDKFASEILIPKKELHRFLETLQPDHYPSKEQIINFADEIGIAPSIVVGRLQHDRLPRTNPIPYSHYHDLKVRLEWKFKSTNNN